MKLKHRMTALALAACCGIPMISGVPEPAVLTAAAAELPDWVPQSFDDALKLLNHSGAVCARDGVICYVQKVYTGSKLSYGLEYSSPTYQMALVIMDETFTYGSQEEGLVDMEAGFSLHVTCYEPGKNISMALTPYTETHSGTRTYGHTCTFETDEKGNVTQTDPLAWVPDAPYEFDAWLSEQGNIAARDGHVLYCGLVNYSTGVSLLLSQEGTAKLEETYTDSVEWSSPDAYAADGAASHVIRLYTPDQPGLIKATWTIAREWEPEDSMEACETRYFSVNKWLEVTEITEAQYLGEEPVDEAPFPRNWVPNTFDEALEHLNTVGTTCARDGIVCYVRKIPAGITGNHILRFTEDSDVQEIRSKKFCTLRKPQSINSPVIADGVEPSFDLMVYTFDVQPGQTLGFTPKTVQDGMESGTECFTFVADAEGNITETGIHGWVPQTMEAYEAVIREQGNVSLHGDYVLFCGPVNYSTGASFRTDFYGLGGLEQVYAGSVRLSTVDENYISGNASHLIRVYAPVKSGTLRAKWIIGPEWEPVPELETVHERYYAIDKDLHIREIMQADFTEPAAGDANGDGELDLVDVIVLQKWLLGKGELACWQSMDLCPDGVIDSFDIAMLKRTLLKRR